MSDKETQFDYTIPEVPPLPESLKGLPELKKRELVFLKKAISMLIKLDEYMDGKFMGAQEFMLLQAELNNRVTNILNPSKTDL